MALKLGKASGGVLNVTAADGATSTNLILPESGTVSSVGTTVMDNAIARYDGTTGKLQNSGVIIDDNGNIGIGATTPSGNFAIETQQNYLGTSKITSCSIGRSGSGYPQTGYNFISTSGTNVFNYSVADKASALRYTSGGFEFYSAPDGTVGAPITFTNIMNLDNKGNLLLKSGTGGLGYGTGAGGTVTQLTSKSNYVTLNKPSGRIIMHNAALASGASVVFVFGNSLINHTDLVYCHALDSASVYSVDVYSVSEGSCSILVKNEAAISLAVAVPLAFCIIKGVVS